MNRIPKPVLFGAILLTLFIVGGTALLASDDDTPAAGGVAGTVTIDFEDRTDVKAECHVAEGAKAWDCIQQALGSNVSYSTDPAMGVFITGFHGVTPVFAQCQCFWEFLVNGQSSNVGVSQHNHSAGDAYTFRIGR